VRLVVPVLTRVLSALLALAIIAAGVLVIVEVIANWTGRGFVLLPPDWPDELRHTTWDDSLVRALAAGALAVGMLLLLLALWPHPPLTLPTTEAHVRIERRALEEALHRRLASVDGASAVRVRASRRLIDARDYTTRRLEPQRVRERAQTQLSEFCALHHVTLERRVRLRTRGESK
jgi:Family of unknown function (DUF6286)